MASVRRSSSSFAIGGLELEVEEAIVACGFVENAPVELRTDFSRLPDFDFDFDFDFGFEGRVFAIGLLFSPSLANWCMRAVVDVWFR